MFMSFMCTSILAFLYLQSHSGKPITTGFERLRAIGETSELNGRGERNLWLLTLRATGKRRERNEKRERGGAEAKNDREFLV